MPYRFFTVPVLSSEEAEAALNRFCAEHRIATVEKQFVANGDGSFWSICICYAEKDGDLGAGRKGKIDYREVLTERDFVVFAKLRALRKTIAEREGLPAYALFTNEQLAAMVRQRATSAAALAGIDGIGRARIEKFGNAFLDILRAELQGSLEASANTSDEENPA
jgi:superfamily II DNA helicase RecQ